MRSLARTLIPLVVAALGLVTSGALTVCVSSDRGSISWGGCCCEDTHEVSHDDVGLTASPEPASCCSSGERDPRDERAPRTSPKNCADFAVVLGDDWSPASAADLELPPALALEGSPLPSARLVAWPPAFRPVGGVPPPQRPQRSPILRC